MRPHHAPILLLALLAPFAVRAETIAVLVVSAQELTEGQQQLVVDASEAALKRLTGLEVKSQGRKAVLAGPKRRCGTDVDCLVGLAGATSAQHALLLSLALGGGQLYVNGFWVDVARRKATYQAARGAPVSEPDAAAEALVSGLVPGFLKKGWGGVALEAPAGATVRADGKRLATTPLEGPLALPEGSHEVDVILPSGEAQLQRVTVLEGRRVSLAVQTGPLLPPAGAARSELLRTTSYVLWSAGALALAGSFIAAGISHQKTEALVRCEGASRECTTFSTAQQQLDQARTLATTANWLLGSGAVLAVGGAGLFTIDLVERGKR